MTLTVVIEQETDGRGIAEIPELPEVLASGRTAQDAQAKAQALAVSVLQIASSTVRRDLTSRPLRSPPHDGVAQYAGHAGARGAPP